MQNKSYVMKEIVCKLRFRENVEFEMDKTNMSYPKQEFWKDPDRMHFLQLHRDHSYTT